MDLSVVVPTLNGRDRLRACLDALAERVPNAEVVVVNGPSADGTTGMLQERDDVSALVEVSDRNLNVARNAGIAESTGDVVALVGQDVTVEETWRDGVAAAMDDGATVVTGPVHRAVRAGMTTESVETRTIAGRDVTYFAGENVAFERETLESVDGFDENLHTGGARDCAHRLAGQGSAVTWSSSVCVESGDDGEGVERDWGTKYRALAYRMVKNYGPRLTVFRRTFQDALADARSVAREVVAGDAEPSLWFGGGKQVVGSIVLGAVDGLRARFADRSESRNPAGLSSRSDRAVERYDWR
ncbi:glycosyltransferase family 2 protein [Halomicrococcus sp. NG-SE-24]|uniref:glycosyltransferase family 2 protein n=1 Tax=Halomicrococcus sp. NG-SE-24 TaxID=3436928 RepID=UPI003D98C05A